MKKQFLLVSLLFFTLCSCGFIESSDTGVITLDTSASEKVHLFFYFKGNGEEGVYLAASKDGRKFANLNDGQPIFQAPTTMGNGLTRDPSVVLGPDNRFHMVWTTGWWRTQSFGLAHSDNLLGWSEAVAIPVNENLDSALNVWAPEIFYSSEEQQYQVVYASTVRDIYPDGSSEPGPDNKGLEHRQYAVTSQDLKSWSPTELFFDQGFNVIDAMIAKRSQGDYVMVIKDETLIPEPKKNMRLAFSKTATGPWSAAGIPVTPEGVWAEGPSLNRIGDDWLLYFDAYKAGGYGAMRSRDLKVWDDISDEIVFPDGVRHGTVITVDAKRVAHLMEDWKEPKAKSSYIKSSSFGVLDNGHEVRLFELSNAIGMSVSIMDMGATIVSLNTPDRGGKLADIALGFDNPRQYLTDSPYFGAIVGRYANRIKEGKFSLGGEDYQLAVNNGPNALHGGVVGFDKRMWAARPYSMEDYVAVEFSLVSEDGDEGYPGTLETTITYKLNNENHLTVDYRAVTDKTTVVNLSQHTYFNLNGHASGAITDHQLILNAGHYTPVDKNLIPTGDVLNVAGTVMDFRVAKPIGRDIDIDIDQLNYGKGYDHNWVLDKNETTEKLQLAALVYAPKTGRRLEIYTDQPGIQFYAGNFLDGSVIGKEGAAYHHRNGLCLETQHYPDSPNQPDFPSTVLRPGEVYKTTTEFHFSTK